MSTMYEKRDKIIGKKFTQPSYSGGIRRFEGLTIDEINDLAKIGCVRLEGKHNDSPKVEEILHFMSYFEDKKITAHGYVDEEARNYPYVNIEGVEYKGKVTPEMQKMFTDLFRLADSFELKDDGFYCWYD